MTQYVYLIPLFPLLGFLINGLGWKSIPKNVAGPLASFMMLLSFAASLMLFFEVKASPLPQEVHLFDFIRSGSLYLPFTFLVDPLSSLFLLIITGVGLLIHIYSAGYMHDDPGVVRYFAYLNLFVFSMLLLVLGGSYFIMFIGWEGVGLCSYLLIGFWFKKPEYTKAARKAFVMNRIGDLGFLVGMMLVLYHFGTLGYQEFFSAIPNTDASSSILNWIAICFFIGAMGKSAQIPLYTWLPDAMAGPTPVSALIHAATMVTAGIYMIARSHTLYTLAEHAQTLVAYIGLATALLAASIALRQYDIKKVLAYSTVSQLGFMFVALGMGAYTTAVFHVMTHAFFKALLFLGSGSVIHAMGGEQDIRYMGGLGKKLPITKNTFLIGCLAIAGIPGFSGFFSKDEILASAFAGNKIIWVLLLLAALMTAFYMFRLYFLTFSGTFRGSKEQEHHLHESPSSMTIPLVILAVLAVVGGYVGLPPVISEHHSLNHFLASSVVNDTHHHLSHSTEWMLMGISTVLILVMIFLAKNITSKTQFVPASGLAKVLEQKWYVDELYDRTIIQPIMRLSAATQQWIEKSGIDGAVNGVGKLVRWGSDRVRLMQNGQVGYYLFMMVVGMVVVFALSLYYMF